MTIVANASHTRISRSPEAELLICCSRTNKDPEIDQRIRAILQGRINWEYLLLTAEEHGIMPLLFWHLKGFSNGVPAVVLDHLETHFRQNKLRSILLFAELLDLLDVLKQQGIPAIPYKGPSLATAIYGDLALRQSGDLDILLSKQYFLEAKEVLLSRGYRMLPELTNAQEAAFLRFERECLFVREDLHLYVELQWEIMPDQFSFPLKVDHLWANLQHVPFGRNSVPNLSPEDLLLILCVHGSKHFWTDLRWICDVAETVGTHRDIDWGKLTRYAAARGSQRMLFLGLFLANDLLGANLPEGIMRRVRSDLVVRRLVGEVYGWLFAESDDPRGILRNSAFYPFHFRARERHRDKFFYWVRTTLTPNWVDWLDNPLPERLFFVYCVLRPIRLVAKYGKRLLSRSSRLEKRAS